VSIGTNEAVVVYDRRALEPDDLVRAVKANGYGVAAVDGEAVDSGDQASRAAASEDADGSDKETAAHRREYRQLMRKFWFAAAVAVPVMLI